MKDLNLFKVETHGGGKRTVAFLEHLSRAVGGVFGPWQKVRHADADAKVKEIAAVADRKVAVIAAESAVEVSELERRAALRFFAEQGMDQANMESVVAKAIPLLTEGEPVERVDPDWIRILFSHARLVSNDEIQSLWARILSGEANQPGSFSRRTLACLSTLELSQAMHFETVARCTLVNARGDADAFIFSWTPFFEDAGLSLSVLLDLETTGLINLMDGGFFSWQVDDDAYEQSFTYFERSITLRGFGRGVREDFVIGTVRLTAVGRELLRVCQPTPLPGFLECLQQEWQGRGHEVVLDALPRRASTERA